MRLNWFMLADAALAHEGKFYIHGGGINRIYALAFPWNQPQLAFAAHVIFEVQDSGRHTLGLAVVDPAEHELWAAELPFVVPEPKPGEDHAGSFAVTLANLAIAAEGQHHIRVSFDGSEVARHPLTVVLYDDAVALGAE